MSGPVENMPLIEVKGTSSEAAEMMALVELWRATHAMAAADAGADLMDPQATSKAITAAAIMAGTYVGNMIAIGVMSDRDKRRAGEMVLRNFRQGIEIGKRQAERMIRNMPVGGSA